MAKTKKKHKRFQFELGIPGLIFVTGLLVCLFLWMFILGFWLGQRMVATKARQASSPVARKTLQEKRLKPPLLTEEVKPPAVVPEKGKTASTKDILPKTTSEKPPSRSRSVTPEKPPQKGAKKVQPPSGQGKASQKTPPLKMYTLQVASFRSPKEAQKYARFLGSRGYEAMVRRVSLPKKGVWYRVYVGKFKSLQEAKKFGAQLQKKEKIKTYYITRIEAEH